MENVEKIIILFGPTGVRTRFEMKLNNEKYSKSIRLVCSFGLHRVIALELKSSNAWNLKRILLIYFRVLFGFLRSYGKR